MDITRPSRPILRRGAGNHPYAGVSRSSIAWPPRGEGYIHARLTRSPTQPQLTFAGDPAATDGYAAGAFTCATNPRTSAAGSEYASPSADSIAVMNASAQSGNG
jgi:hypothetical protein